MFSERAAVRKPEVLVDATRSPGRNASASTRSSGRKYRKEPLLSDQRVAELLVGEIRLLPESCRTSGRIYQKFCYSAKNLLGIRRLLPEVLLTSGRSKSLHESTRSSALLCYQRSAELLVEGKRRKAEKCRSSGRIYQNFWSDQKFW